MFSYKHQAALGNFRSFQVDLGSLESLRGILEAKPDVQGLLVSSLTLCTCLRDRKARALVHDVETRSRELWKDPELRFLKELKGFVAPH